MTAIPSARRVRRSADVRAADTAADPAPLVEPGEDGAATPPDADRPKLSKAALVLSLLQRPEGASLAQLVTATSWLPHTTRAALTGLKRKGHTITSDKPDGVRIYRVTAPAAAA